MSSDGYCFDIEADNLYLQSKTIWIITCTSLDKTRTIDILPFKEGKEESRRKFLEWHNSFGEEPLVVSFNGLGYDHWMLWKHLDIPFHVGKRGKDWLDYKPCRFLDLYVLSQFIEPDRPRHGLKSYGEELTNNKIEFQDWTKFSEEMRMYCHQDVNLTIDVYNLLIKKLGRMYKSFYRDKYKDQYKTPFKSLQKDYYLYSAQAFTGIKFDKEAAEKLVAEIDQEMLELEQEVLPQLPPRKLKEGEKKFYSFPAKPFKKDGSLSSTMEKWLEKHQAEICEDSKVLAYGKKYSIIGGQTLDIELPMEIKDGDDIKEWFISRGWEPSYYNFKRDPDSGKPMRDSRGEVITTTPKLQEMGKLCPNLLKLDGDLPKKIVKFLSLRNRRSVVSGWLSDWRLEFDGRLSAEITGYTPTFRVKHSKIVNLPKASPEVLKGYEVRSLFIVEDGMRYVSADAGSLENKTVASLTYAYDNGKFADIVLNGDSHSVNAKLFFPKETAKFDLDDPKFSKEDPEFKPYRNKAKTGAYSLAYGASVKKFTKSLGLSESDGEIAYNNYWNSNLGLKLLKQNSEKEWSSKGNKMYIAGKDGRILTARSKHLLVNLQGQSLGATVITYALCIVDNWLGWMDIDELGRPFYSYKGKIVKRLAAFHDQGDFEADPEVSEEIGQMIVKGIERAGELLSLPVPLNGEWKVGNNAAEIH